MSPEQARGRPVDKRSDIWAFGCVLYEMLTGRKAFDRETASDTMAAILEREPDWRRLPARTPAPVRRLLRRCLEKDVSRRLRDIGDACLELDDAIGRSAGPRASRKTSRDSGGNAGWPRRPRSPPWRPRCWPACSGARGARQPGTRELLHPAFTHITSQSGLEWFPSLSPDGKWVVYGGDAEGNRDIFLQSTTGQTPINLTAESADDDDQPAFSPDGERIAFRSSRDGGGIFVMGRTGEAVRRLTRRGFKPTWSPEGREIAFTTENADLDPQNTVGLSSLWVVDVASGQERQLGQCRRGVAELVTARTADCLHDARGDRGQHPAGHLDRRSLRCGSGRSHDGRRVELESGVGARWQVSLFRQRSRRPDQPVAGPHR